jgi:predicted transcriptional regulator
MDPEPVVAPGWWTVEAFLSQVAVSTRRRAFPVVSFDGQAIGVTSLGELTRLPEQERFTSRVADVARKPPAVPTAGGDDMVIDVLSKVVLRPGRDLVLVLDHGRLAGVIGPDDIGRTLELAASGHPIRPDQAVTPGVSGGGWSPSS